MLFFSKLISYKFFGTKKDDDTNKTSNIIDDDILTDKKELEHIPVDECSEYINTDLTKEDIIEISKELGDFKTVSGMINYQLRL